MVICPVCPLQVCQHPCEQTQQWMRGWGALKKGKSPNQLIYGDGRHQETIGLEYNHLFAAVPPRYVESVLYWCAAWAGCMESKRSRDLSYGSTRLVEGKVHSPVNPVLAKLERRFNRRQGNLSAFPNGSFEVCGLYIPPKPGHLRLLETKEA